MSDIRVDDHGDGRGVYITFDRWDGVVGVILANDEAADLLSKLRAQVGEWAAERDEARAEYRYDWNRAALDPDDPDHPYYGDYLRERADTIRKAEKENRP